MLVSIKKKSAFSLRVGSGNKIGLIFGKVPKGEREGGGDLISKVLSEW